MSRIQLTPSERQILERTLYAESFDRLLEETGLDAGSLRDDLNHLVSLRLIQVCRMEGERKPVSFYDLDHLGRFAFRATGSGLRAMQRPADAAVKPNRNRTEENSSTWTD